jgi:outer membrane lipoprotein-sorting protein
MQRSQQAYYYAGDDMKAQVTMDLIDADGGRRTRVMTMLRIDQTEGGNQKYFIYFHEPGDVRRMTFMVWKDPAEADDRWIYVPAVDLVRRIAADDSRSSFVGSDFTYEDISGRDVASDEHTLVREETVEGRDAYVVESRPRTSAEYTRRLSWIDRTSFLPLKEEYYDAQQELFRVFTAEEITTVGAGGVEWPTVTRRTMANVQTGHRTEVQFTDIQYDLDLNEGDFSERRMRQPPRDWIRQ